MSFKLEDADADVIYAHDDAIDSQISGIVDEIKAEERRYVELLDCISKVRKLFLLQRKAIAALGHFKVTLQLAFD